MYFVCSIAKSSKIQTEKLNWIDRVQSNYASRLKYRGAFGQKLIKSMTAALDVKNSQDQQKIINSWIFYFSVKMLFNIYIYILKLHAG